MKFYLFFKIVPYILDLIIGTITVYFLKKNISKFSIKEHNFNEVCKITIQFIIVCFSFVFLFMMKPIVSIGLFAVCLYILWRKHARN